MSNFDYEIQGVKLTDPRGAWYLLPGTDTLPKYPGIRVTRFNIPGGSGEKQVQHAPTEPASYLFRIRFNAIDTRIGSPTYLRMGRDYDEKIAFLERNINEFMFTTRLGAQGHLGNVEIKRINPTSQSASTDSYRMSHGSLSAVGRVIASTEPEVSENQEYADFEFIYENPTGTWYSEWDYRRIGAKPAGTHGIWVNCGTAPIDDALIAIKPTNGDMPAGVLVRNEAGIGFEVKKTLTANRWHVFDTYSWATGSSPDIWFSTPKPDKTSMTEYGRPVGSALVITPGIKNVSTPRGIVTVRLTAPGEIRTAVRSKWF
jgi:hypothetical protein